MTEPRAPARFSSRRCSRTTAPVAPFEHISSGGPPVHRQADRIGAQLLRTGGDRDREHAAAQELRESLQQQTATADVLKVISRSASTCRPCSTRSPNQLCRLCRAERTAIRIAKDGLFTTLPTMVLSRPIASAMNPSSLMKDRWRAVSCSEARQSISSMRRPIRTSDWPAGLGREACSMLGVPLMREGVLDRRGEVAAAKVRCAAVHR